MQPEPYAWLEVFPCSYIVKQVKGAVVIILIAVF